MIDERFYAGCREVDRSIVEEGIRRGVFLARDPAEAASTLRAIFDGLMLQWLAEKDPEATFEMYRDRCERELLYYLTGAGGNKATEEDPMKDVRRERRRAAPTKACGKPAEEGSPFCASCGLEWTLFHRDVRVPKERSPAIECRVEMQSDESRREDRVSAGRQERLRPAESPNGAAPGGPDPGGSRRRSRS